LFSYDALRGSRSNMRTFFCSAMMHYEAAAAICALFFVQL
jgi:hypothetical protein